MNFRLAVGLMLLLFVVESTIFPWLLPDALYGRVVPHFVFVFVLYSGLYGGRHTALVLGVCFGFLQDIVFYGQMLGVHALSMGLCGYLTGLLLERRRSPMMMALSVIGIAGIMYDSLVYAIYRAFRVTAETYDYVFAQWIMPSLFLQLAFALAIYIPARRLFETGDKPEGDDKE